MIQKDSFSEVKEKYKELTDKNLIKYLGLQREKGDNIDAEEVFFRSLRDKRFPVEKTYPDLDHSILKYIFERSERIEYFYQRLMIQINGIKELEGFLVNGIKQRCKSHDFDETEYLKCFEDYKKGLEYHKALCF